MHPLIGYGAGALLGALLCGVLYGYRERFQKIALAVGVGVVLAGGALLLWRAVPGSSGLDKRALALIGLGLAAKIGGYNLGIAAQVPSGGFSSARTESMIGLAIAAVLLALAVPALKPA